MLSSVLMRSARRRASGMPRVCSPTSTRSRAPALRSRISWAMREIARRISSSLKMILPTPIARPVVSEALTDTLLSCRVCMSCHWPVRHKKTSITIALDGMKESSSIGENRPQRAGRRTDHAHTPFQPHGTGVKGSLRRVYHYHPNHAKKWYLYDVTIRIYCTPTRLCLLDAPVADDYSAGMATPSTALHGVFYYRRP